MPYLSAFAYTDLADAKPLPPSPEDSARWQHTALRRRLLDGTYERDLVDSIQDHVGSIKRQAWGPPDMSSNPFKSTCEALAVLYTRPPEVRHAAENDDEQTLSDFRKALASAGLWASMPRVQKLVIGCNEYLIRVYAYEDGRVRFRPVAPDYVIAKANPEIPDDPIEVRELRLRKVNGRSFWTWDVWSIEDTSYPVHRIEKVAENASFSGADLTIDVYGRSMSGPGYPETFRRSDGTPVLPYVMYHKQRSGDQIWNPYEGRELVSGTLTNSVIASFTMHVLRDCSWPQRWVANAQPAGLDASDVDNRGARSEIVTDPSALLVLENLDPSNPTIQVGQWQPGADPLKLTEVGDRYASRLAKEGGVPASDMQRASDPRSGYAIALDNAGKREVQRRFAPHFEHSDRQTIALAAIALNRATGSSLPEDGYEVVYREIPLSADELRARREHVLELLDANMMRRIDAYMHLNPGISREQAEKDLENMLDGERSVEVSASAGTESGVEVDVDAERTTQPDELIEGGANPVASLNGAQVQAAQGIVTEVAMGQLPRDSGVQMLSKFFNIEIEDAELIMGTVGRGFTPTEITTE